MATFSSVRSLVPVLFAWLLLATALPEIGLDAVEEAGEAPSVDSGILSPPGSTNMQAQLNHLANAASQALKIGSRVNLKTMRQELQVLRTELDAQRSNKAGGGDAGWDQQVQTMETQIEDLEEMLATLAAQEAQSKHRVVVVSHADLQAEIDRLKEAVEGMDGTERSNKVLIPNRDHGEEGEEEEEKELKYQMNPKASKDGSSRHGGDHGAGQAGRIGQLGDADDDAAIGGDAAGAGDASGHRGASGNGGRSGQGGASGHRGVSGPGGGSGHRGSSRGRGDDDDDDDAAGGASGHHSKRHAGDGGDDDDEEDAAGGASGHRGASGSGRGGNGSRSSGSGHGGSSGHGDDDDEGVAGVGGIVQGGRGPEIDMAMPFGNLEPFGREDTAQDLTEASIRESDAMVDQLERAEVAEERRAIFRALTRLRGAAITSFDGIARAHTGNIDEYSTKNQWRKAHPVRHLANEESDVSRWAFPDNRDT